MISDFGNDVNVWVAGGYSHDGTLKLQKLATADRLGGVHMCAHTSSAIRTHLPSTEIEINALSLLFIEVFRCVRTRHPPSASFIRHPL